MLGARIRFSNGGPWLAYETPVLGYPWAIPFEFPVYQLSVAGVASLGVPIDVAGRLVGFGFFLAILWPLRVLYDAILSWPCHLSRNLRSLSDLAALPLLESDVFDGIRGCALFFSFAWLALTARYFERPGRYTALAALVSGCLAILTKSTTFPAFAAVGGLLMLYRFWDFWRIGDSRAIRMSAVMLINLLFPFVVGILWVWYSDHVKNAIFLDNC